MAENEPDRERRRVWVHLRVYDDNTAPEASPRPAALLQKFAKHHDQAVRVTEDVHSTQLDSHFDAGGGQPTYFDIVAKKFKDDSKREVVIPNYPSNYFLCADIIVYTVNSLCSPHVPVFPKPAFPPVCDVPHVAAVVVAVPENLRADHFPQEEFSIIDERLSRVDWKDRGYAFLLSSTAIYVSDSEAFYVVIMEAIKDAVFAFSVDSSQRFNFVREQKSVKAGSAAVRSFRLILCGQGRAGKTSFCRSLLGLRFSGALDSTIGVELNKAACRLAKHEHGAAKWVWSSMKNIEKYLELGISAALEECLSREGPNNDMITTRMVCMSKNVDTTMVNLEPVAAADLKTATARASHQVKEFHRLNALSKRRPISQARVLLEIMDFAGQDTFTIVQHLVVSEERCGVAVVFDASKPLDALSEVSVAINGSQYRVHSVSAKTNLETIEEWLAMIHQSTSGKCPQYIIGCHTDRIRGRSKQKRLLLKNVRKRLWSVLQNKPYCYSVEAIFFVSNTRSGSRFFKDKRVEQFRQRFINDMMKSRPMQVPVPLRWLLFEFTLHFLSEQNRPVLIVEDATALAKRVCYSPTHNDALKLLQFHHNLGHLLHFQENPDLRHYVITDVHWLIRIISALLIPRHNVQQQDRHFREHYNLLYEKGILSESLVQHMWQLHCPWEAQKLVDIRLRQFVFSLLEEFGLLFNTKQKMQLSGEAPCCKFIMPSLVCMKSEVVLPHGTGPLVYSLPLCLSVGPRTLFPLTLFWRLAVCLMLHLRESGAPYIEPTIHQNSVRLLFKSCFWLELQHFSSGLILTVQFDSRAFPLGVSDSSIDLMGDVCPSVLSAVEAKLRDLTADCRKYLTWERAAICLCLTDDRKCAQHQVKGCSKVECQHFIELKQGAITQCSLGGHCHDIVSLVTEMWLPSLKPLTTLTDNRVRDEGQLSPLCVSSPNYLTGRRSHPSVFFPEVSARSESPWALNNSTWPRNSGPTRLSQLSVATPTIESSASRLSLEVSARSESPWALNNSTWPCNSGPTRLSRLLFTAPTVESSVSPLTRDSKDKLFSEKKLLELADNFTDSFDCVKLAVHLDIHRGSDFVKVQQQIYRYISPSEIAYKVLKKGLAENGHSALHQRLEHTLENVLHWPLELLQC